MYVRKHICTKEYFKIENLDKGDYIYQPIFNFEQEEFLFTMGFWPKKSISITNTGM